MPVLVSAAGALCSLRASRWKCGPCFSCQGCAVAVDVRSMHSSLTAASSRERGGRTCRGAWRGRAVSVPEHPKHVRIPGRGKYADVPREISTTIPRTATTIPTGNNNSFQNAVPPNGSNTCAKKSFRSPRCHFTHGGYHTVVPSSDTELWGMEPTEILRSLVIHLV